MGRFSSGGSPGLWLLTHYWGALFVVVARGAIDADNAERLDDYLRTLPPADVLIDAWDVTACDAAGVAVLKAAKQRTDESGWGFAILADPGGPCAKALQDDRSGPTVLTFADRYAARTALQLAS